MINPKTGRPERVFVNLDAVYPKANDSTVEMSFEELRAAKRGWLSKTRQRSSSPNRHLQKTNGNKAAMVSAAATRSQSPPSREATSCQVDVLAQDLKTKVSLDEEPTQNTQSFIEQKADREEQRPAKVKKMKIREIRQETQTSK